MNFEAALKAHLQAAAITALVADRITPVQRQETAAVPAIVYQVVTHDQVSNLSGRDGSLRNVRVQLDIWARKHSDILLVDAAVRTQMDIAAATFRAVLTPGGGDDYEPETKLYRRLLEFSCWFTEA